MATIYTQNQREAVQNASVYDYMHLKLRPPVCYGASFCVHTNHRRGEVTSAKDSGSIRISVEHGYKNWATGYCANDGQKGIPTAYALMDYYNSVGSGCYSASNPSDCAEIIAEIAADLGVPQDRAAKAAPPKQIQHRKSSTLLDKYNAAMTSKRPPVAVPKPAKSGSCGQTPDADIVRYMTGRGVAPEITKDLIDAGLLYLSEAAPYYKVAKDDAGNCLRDREGHLQYIMDKNGHKVPQTYVDQATGETRPKMQYNLVFASKGQRPESIFFERKPLGKRGQAYIAANSSPAGYFGFTGHLPDFQQADIPKNTGENMRAYICEAPIDAISLYALHQQMGITDPAEYISISGVSKDMAVQRAICEGYDCVLAFDNDPAGKEHMDARRSQAFIDPLTSEEVSLPAIVPPEITFDLPMASGSTEHITSKDWNDVLLAITKGISPSVDPIRAMGQDSSSVPSPAVFRSIEKTCKSLRKCPVQPINARSNGETRSRFRAELMQ